MAEFGKKPGTAKVGAISKAQNCKRGTLWALLVAKYEKKIKGGPLRFLKIPMFSRFWTVGFCFGRGSGVSSMFWTSVVQVDDVEQMNKKWTDRVELTKKN